MINICYYVYLLTILFIVTLSAKVHLKYHNYIEMTKKLQNLVLKHPDVLSLYHLDGTSVQGMYYGNTGCGVFKWGVQNWKGFCIRINILKGNYWMLRIGLMGASEVFKNQSFKNPLFSSSQKKKYLKLKSWLNFNAIIVFY